MISIGIILTMASISVVKGNMTIGALTAILMYNHMLIDPLIEILDIQQKIVKLVVSMRKINDVFVLPNDININKPIVKIDKVQFKNVSYSYEGQNNVLNNVNFEARIPDNICVIGKTGTGKSTFANLIAGLYAPTEGQVIYYNNNQQVNGMPNISYLIQDGYLFDKSIVENIKIANPGISKAEIDDLIEVCCLEEVLKVHGYNSIGENGLNLSGGEKKRVRIAQMLANKKADIYIFDELMSALDKTTATKIVNNILALNLKKICIFIEHNTNSIIPCEKVIKINRSTI